MLMAAFHLVVAQMLTDLKKAWPGPVPELGHRSARRRPTPRTLSRWRSARTGGCSPAATTAAALRVVALVSHAGECPSE